MIDEKTEMPNEDNVSYLRMLREDKDFFSGNAELERYLVFKHKELIKRQEDLTHLLRIELEEVLANAREAQRVKELSE